MNNKGFTLVELLATLVVLSIVMSIGTFSIIAIVNSSKNKNYELLISNIKSAAEVYYQECKYSNESVSWCDKTGNYNITLGDLVRYGYLKGNQKNSDDTFTIVNPKNNESIADCMIHIQYDYDTNKVAVEANGTDSCPTYN